uniref:SMAP domain-containing protein n=1 Tax=Anisakis simplex TaxID=6269 RepID=A0A0M3IZL9_ANISI
LQSATSSGLATSRPSNATAWSSMLAAAATDSKQIDKFKRLMGIKKTEEGNDEIDVNRQQALYSQLDQQYAVARSTTHLSRGQGLGFH